jgi:hypothetical protein
VNSAIRDRLLALEDAEHEERSVVIAFLAGRGVEIDAAERNGALRRAELLLAAGGDPRRTPPLSGRAVAAVAADLDAPERRRALRDGLEALAREVAGLPAAAGTTELLLADSDLAWECLAAALLADELGREDESL